jgi:hypothetical protein
MASSNASNMADALCCAKASCAFAKSALMARLAEGSEVEGDAGEAGGGTGSGKGPEEDRAGAAGGAG